MTSNHESSLFNIDFNAEIFNQEIDNGDVQQQNSNEMHHLPDLNINVAQNIDLNIIPNSPLQFSFDLNVQPFDTCLSEDIQEYIDVGWEIDLAVDNCRDFGS
ncbi:hypothetical protein MTR_4g036365 [Medicago truncatula]|uniref:Uncharacterized protein n=1 Tax=Medicago truncatula TaxID=3880 RepID=A0A072UU75_MEDTR|nr:hypothetical protein MTR_4g036365 [Medicago truncatula]